MALYLALWRDWSSLLRRLLLSGLVFSKFSVVHAAPIPKPSSLNTHSVVGRDSTKYVFMHHMVGNTFPYTPADWQADFSAMKGIDAVALNMGPDGWQPGKIKDAYDAAKGANMKLFISFDFAAGFSCKIDDVVATVKKFSAEPAQFKIGGKPLISSFEGKCLGSQGWSSVKQQTSGFLMPFIDGIDKDVGGSEWQFLDSWLCWGCAWPAVGGQVTDDRDATYLQQLGNRYAAGVSPWFFTHLDDKNRYLKGDEWLINVRWDQVIKMRDKVSLVEMLTWNDYGESSYLGPIRGDPPEKTNWIKGFPHEAWMEMSQYYITYFKTGTAPQIKEDAIYFWSRPYLIAAAPQGQKGEGADQAEDFLWAAIFATSDCSVTLQAGDSKMTFDDIKAGVSTKKVALKPGAIKIQMSKGGGKPGIDMSPTDFKIADSAQIYNLNAYVGVAKGNKTA